MHPLQNGSQVTERPADKPVSGSPGYFTESGENNIPSYPGADWFNNTIDEFLSLLDELGVSFDQESSRNLADGMSNFSDRIELSQVAISNNVSYDNVSYLKLGSVSNALFFIEKATSAVYKSNVEINGTISNVGNYVDGVVNITVDGLVIPVFFLGKLSYELPNLSLALTRQYFVVGDVIRLKGWNHEGDGGNCKFICVSQDSSFGIDTASGVKLQFVDGMDQWKAQYVGSLPKYIAHRGAAGYTEKNLYFVPENTIYSARRSAEAGFWGLEADAKVTSDGQIAVFHDTTVDRTITGETGPVSSFTMNQLKSFDAGSYVSDIYTNARVMDYNEWFASCRKFSLVPCAEISVAMTDAQVDTFLADCLQYYPDGVGVFLQSTNLETLQKIRAKNANITLYRSFSYGSVPDVALFDEMYALGNAGVHFSGGALNADPSIVQAAKDRGLCTSYAIANTAELVQTARDLGIHRIMTDFILGDY